MEHAKSESKIFVQREKDRRLEDTTTIQFPLLDSDFNIVRQDRRRISDRRKSNLKLIWQESQPIRNTTSLTLEVNGKNYFFDTSLEAFNLGRSHQCDVRVENSFVSKHHATIRYDNGEFVLQDESLNGTFMHAEDLGKVRIHGQKAYLFGEGVMSLGKPIDHEESLCIKFNCK